MDDRKLKILTALVDEYIVTGEPVGSKAIMKHVKASSATIRNEMAELEKQGYLEQPHTSAGRVPTYNGYRLYVDRLTQSDPLSADEKKVLDQMLDLDTGGIRTRLAERWQAYSEGPLGLENIRSIAERCAGELNDSGAMARNAERWETEAYTSDVQEILDFAEWRHKIIDVAVEQITSADGRVDFLTETSYKKNKGGPIPNAVELANEKGEVQ